MEEEKKEVEVENTSHEELNKNNTEEKKDKKIFKKNQDEKLLKEIEELKTKNNDLLNKVMYSQAEFANYKKRKEQEVSNMLKYSNMDIVLEILPIVDNFERAIKLDDSNLNDELSKFLSGFKMIYTNLISILNELEVKEIDCKGLEFDPNKMEAVLTDSNKELPSNVVLEVLQKGYTYKDKVIRVAMVKVNE